MVISDEILKKMEDLNFTDEQIEFVKEEVIKEYISNNGHKIRCGVPYMVFKQVYGNHTFYKIPIYSKALDGTRKQALQEVAFSKCDPVAENKDKIIINKMFEDFYFSANDKYNHRPIIRILSYDYVDKEVKEVRENTQAINQYKDELNNNFEELPF